MNYCRHLRNLLLLGIIFYLLCCCSSLSVAQGPSSPESKSLIEPRSFVAVARQDTFASHRFWDKRNLALFSATAALSGADFVVTRENLQSGGRELNPITRIVGKSTPGLAINFGAQTASVIAISYLFHKTGHHKLERITSYVNICGSGSAVIYGLTHR